MKKFDNNGTMNKWEFAHESMEKYHSLLWKYIEYMKNTDIESINISQRGGVTFKLKDNDIVLLTHQYDERSMPMDILNFGTYEKEELMVVDKILNESLQSDECIIDIGANIGYTSIHWAKKFKNKIFSFEPIRSTYEICKKNTELNKVNDSIYVYNYGLSNKRSTETFIFYPWCSANSSLQNLEDREDAKRIECDIYCFDELEEFKDYNIGFVKCDVEGNEKNVFLGMNKTIDRCKPVITCELLRKYAERFGYHTNEVLKYLNEKGYICYGIDTAMSQEPIDDMNETDFRNFVFLHSYKHKDIINSIWTIAQK